LLFYCSKTVQNIENIVQNIENIILKYLKNNNIKKISLLTEQHTIASNSWIDHSP